MISQTAEYAFRAAVALAGTGDRLSTAQQIASATQVPQDYLLKILNLLVRAGLVTAQRGRNGGFMLARPAAEVNLLQVLTAVDPLPRIRRCPLGLPQHESLCKLHRKVDDALSHVEMAFASTSVADLAESKLPEAAHA